MDEGGTGKLARWLDAHPMARLVLIDVWPRVRPRSRGTDYYTVDYDAASPVQALAIERGIPIAILYHTRKAESSDFVETVTGTFGTAAAADTIIVVKRGRGQADATLYITGRDVEERELALRFESSVGTWALLGDAAEYNVGETRQEIIATLRTHGTLTPKQLSEVTDVGYENAKKTMRRMADEGQVLAKSGRYSLPPPVPPVPGVPLSPEDGGFRDKGTGGTGDIGGDEALDYIEQRHDEGADLVVIAMELVRNEFPPPSGCSRWDADAVGDILEGRNR
jgi:hypothetical protein